MDASIEVEPDHRWYLRSRYCGEHEGKVVNFSTHLGTDDTPADSVIRVSVAHRNHHVRMYSQGCEKHRVDTVALIERHSDMLTAFAWSTYRVQPYAETWIKAWKENSWDSVVLT
ncbi:hypothetical protein P9139_17945 [Curtobacterium flaccumfaciens]|nr:hypothetical protein P9139_17945 [Curtobacterium flaccumfaciens]